MQGVPLCLAQAFAVQLFRCHTEHFPVAEAGLTPDRFLNFSLCGNAKLHVVGFDAEFLVDFLQTCEFCAEFFRLRESLPRRCFFRVCNRLFGAADIPLEESDRFTDAVQAVKQPCDVPLWAVSKLDKRVRVPVEDNAGLVGIRAGVFADIQTVDTAQISRAVFDVFDKEGRRAVFSGVKGLITDSDFKVVFLIL